MYESELLQHNLGDTSALVVTTIYLVSGRHTLPADSYRGTLVSTIAACL